jgi:hypothetical protein
MEQMIGCLLAKMKANQEEMKNHQERMKDLMDANLQNMKACLGVTETCWERWGPRSGTSKS